MNIRPALFDRLAQLLVLYERIRIEAFAAAVSAEDLNGLEIPGRNLGIRDCLRRLFVTQSEFASALHKLSQTEEYKLAERKFEKDREMRTLIATVSKASRHFHTHRAKLCGASRIAAAGITGTPTTDAICIAREGFAHATQAMHALVAAFVCDRI
jgi:hypothetical protein